MTRHPPRLNAHRRASRPPVALAAAVLQVLALAVLALLCAAAPSPAQDPLSAAKDHYAAAEYEKALGALDEAKKAPGVAPPTLLAIERYRALCLLALGRKPEAERAIEAVLDPKSGGPRTPDLGGKACTRDLGRAIASAL